MTTPYLQGTGVVPEATALLLRGIQTDAYGEVLGGHKAIYDPLQSVIPTSIPSGGTLPNIVTDGASAGPAVGVISSGTSISAAKGLDFSVATSGTEYLPLPSIFDLRNLGSEPSLIISTWITNKLEAGTSFPAIMGHAYQTGTYHQWSLCHRNTANTLAMQINGARHEFTVQLNTPTLITAHIKRASSGKFTFTTYRNAEQVGATTDVSYPFTDAAASANAKKTIGYVEGFSTAWLGVVHRLQLIKVDQTIDIAGWLASEISRNASRWA